MYVELDRRGGATVKLHLMGSPAQSQGLTRLSRIQIIQIKTPTKRYMNRSLPSFWPSGLWVCLDSGYMSSALRQWHRVQFDGIAVSLFPNQNARYVAPHTFPLKNVIFSDDNFLFGEMTRRCANDKSARDHLSFDIGRQEYDEYDQTALGGGYSEVEMYIIVT